MNSRDIPAGQIDAARDMSWWNADLLRFVSGHCQIQESQGGWETFVPWASQTPVIKDLQHHRFLLVLKARQLGLTWLCLYEILWLVLTRPGIQCGVFSLRETEAKAVLARLRHVWERLPPDYKAPLKADASTRMEFANGSVIMAFSTTSGDSYTLGSVLIDEADLIPDLDRVLRGAKPTIDAGGRIRLISRSDKTQPASLFKAMYRAARDGQSEYKAIFLPWSARPSRTQAWYDQQVRSSVAEHGNRDVVLEQYPLTAEEALAPGESDKRIPIDWLTRATKILPFGSFNGDESIEIHVPPDHRLRHCIGGDPAEGNPTSDESAAVVLREDGLHCATIRGRKQPGVFAASIAKLSEYYHFSRPGNPTVVQWASALIERNNHGHAVIMALNNEFGRVPLLSGKDKRTGWLSSQLGKAMVYDDLVEALRDDQVTVSSAAVADQLQMIRGDDLRPPEGLHDDLAMAYALANEARIIMGVTQGEQPKVVVPVSRPMYPSHVEPPRGKPPGFK